MTQFTEDNMYRGLFLCVTGCDTLNAKVRSLVKIGQIDAVYINDLIMNVTGFEGKVSDRVFWTITFLSGGETLMFSCDEELAGFLNGTTNTGDDCYRMISQDEMDELVSFRWDELTPAL